MPPRFTIPSDTFAVLQATQLALDDRLISVPLDNHNQAPMLLFEHAPAVSELTMDEGEDVLFDQRECERDAIIEAAETIGGHSFESYTSLPDNITGTPLPIL